MFLLDSRLGMARFFMPRPMSIEEYFDQQSWEREPWGSYSTGTAYPSSGNSYVGGEEGEAYTGNEPETAFLPPASGTIGPSPPSSVIRYMPSSSPAGTQTAFLVIRMPVTVGGSPVDAYIAPSRPVMFRLQLRSKTGSLIDQIDEYFDATMRQEVDQASTLTFSIMADNAAAGDIEYPNRVWVRDRWGLVIEKFVIRGFTKRRTGEGTYIDVVCRGAIETLASDPVLEYSTGSEVDDSTGEKTYTEKSVQDIVEELLDMQVQTPKITRMRIDAEIGETELVFNATNSTVLQCLMDLKALLPADIAGHFYIDTKRRFNWRTEIGSHRGESLEIGGALQGVRYTVNYEDMFTRLYMYGEGDDPVSRLTLIDAGEAEEYIESDTVGTYGVIPKVIFERSIKESSQLLAVAEQLVEEFSTPVAEITIDALDLSKADGDVADDYEDLHIGSEYDIVDDDLDIDETVEVTALQRDFDNPLLVQIELKSRRRNLSDILGAIIKNLDAPMEVNGERYPTMGRNFSGGVSAGTVVRIGDIKVDTAIPRMHCGFLYPDDPDSNWKKMGNAQTWRVETYADFADLTEDEDGDSGYTIDTGYWYVRKAGTFILISHFLT